MKQRETQGQGCCMPSGIGWKTLCPLKRHRSGRAEQKDYYQRTRDSCPSTRKTPALTSRTAEENLETEHCVSRQRVALAIWFKIRQCFIVWKVLLFNMNELAFQNKHVDR